MSTTDNISSGDLSSNNPPESDEEETNITAYTNISIYLPPSLFNLSVSSVVLVFSYYSMAMLFPVRAVNMNGYPAVASPVIGASLAEIFPIMNLTEPVVMTLPYVVVSGTPTDQ